MKILLTGASGLVGSHFATSALRRQYEVHAICHANRVHFPGISSLHTINLAQAESIHRTVFDLFPDVIVNAAAISRPDMVDQDPALSRRLNVELPRELAMLANHINAKLIHLSTDLVFDGTKGNYRSTDAPNPINLYGQQKLEAETAVLQYGGPHATVLRITLQNGNSPSEQRGIHETLLKQWSEGKTTTLFTDEIRQPCSSDNVAEVMLELCERDNLHGIFHWAGQEVLSRYEIGSRILKHFGLPELFIAPAKAAEVCKDKPRPLNLTFELQPLEGKIKTKPPSFDEQLQELVIPRSLRKWYHSL